MWEISSLLVAALVLGFVVGFDDGREIFVFKLWFANYLLMSCLALISLSVMVLGHKLAAEKYHLFAEYKIWGIRRYGFRDAMYLHKKGEAGWKGSPLEKIPLGIILPILVALLADGKIWFAAVGMLITSMNPLRRLGRKFIQIPDYEEARTAFAGILATIIFVIVLGLIQEASPTPLGKTLLLMNIALLLSALLPIPQLAGGRMLFTSMYFYVFALVLAGGIAFFIVYMPTIAALAAALVLAVMTTILTYFKREV